MDAGGLAIARGAGKALWVALALTVVMPSAAWAQDADDFVDDDELEFEDDVPEAPPEGDEGAPERGAIDQEGGSSTEAPPDLFDDESEDDLLFEDEVIDPEAEVDPDAEPAPAGLDLDDEDDVRRRAEGEDTADLYRDQINAVDGFPPDEEVMSWEAYLEKYPASVYRERINERIDVLMREQQRARIGETTERVDAQDQELVFVSALGFDNVNPRTRATVALDFGIPGFVGGQADFEYGILRQFSVHGGLSRQFTGWGVDAGARWAFVKSTRLNLVSTLSLDARVGLPGGESNAHVRVLPSWGIGGKIGPVQILGNVTGDFETRTNAGVAVNSGLHVAVRATEAVGVFVETNAYLRNLTRQTFAGDGAGLFAFNQVAFGLKFFPGMRKRTDDPLEISAGASLPYFRNYLGFYEGAVQAHGVLYPKL